jgi:hypothetical protein
MEDKWVITKDAEEKEKEKKMEDVAPVRHRQGDKHFTKSQQAWFLVILSIGLLCGVFRCCYWSTEVTVPVPIPRPTKLTVPQLFEEAQLWWDSHCHAPIPNFDVKQCRLFQIALQFNSGELQYEDFMIQLTKFVKPGLGCYKHYPCAQCLDSPKALTSLVCPGLTNIPVDVESNCLRSQNSYDANDSRIYHWFNQWIPHALSLYLGYESPFLGFVKSNKKCCAFHLPEFKIVSGNSFPTCVGDKWFARECDLYIQPLMTLLPSREVLCPNTEQSNPV